MDEPLPVWAGIGVGLLGAAVFVLALLTRGHWRRTHAARREEIDQVLRRLEGGELTEAQCVEELRMLNLTPEERARIGRR